MGKVKLILSIVLVSSIGLLLYLVKPLIIGYVSGMPKYVAIFVLSFIGALSIIVPVPYTAIVFIMASMGELNPLITALAGGLGSGLGEITGWLLGKLMSKALEHTRYIKQVSTLVKLLRSMKSKLVVSIIVFIFALTPLPDDILFIALGVLRYNLIQALIPCIVGKMVMMYSITMFGGLIFGLGKYVGLNEEAIMIVSIVILVIFMVLLLFIRWDKILSKYLKNM